MNASIKTLAAFSLIAAVGNKIVKEAGNQAQEEIGRRLHEAGLHATAVYPFHALSAKNIDKVADAVERLSPAETSVEMVLSMLLACVVDIRAFVKPDRYGYIDPLIRRLAWALDQFQVNDAVHVAALRQYWGWVG